ncbi:MAG: ATP:cob(I)alamin adenosyltransferase [bacterium]|nr:ATP:cob(I)alamin adenosyltransferase [bacterium]
MKHRSARHTAGSARHIPGAGDDGFTSLLHGKVAKTHPLIAALGALDEVNAMLGLALAHELDQATRHEVTLMQQYIYQVSAAVAARGTWVTEPPAGELVQHMDRVIAELQDELPHERGFIQYAGCPGPAALQVARAICRRAELALWHAAATASLPHELVQVVNRMSLWMYHVARRANLNLGQHEQKIKGPAK